MNIPFNDLKRQFNMFENEYKEAAINVLESGWYVLGDEVKSFEEEFAGYIGVSNCIGVASGLDALILAFDSLGINKGDEVIVAANVYIACIMGITKNGAIPIFVEPDEYFNIDVNKIEEKITDKTKAILAVHLYGQPCNMDEILSIAKKYNLKIVEDCSQSHGAKWNDKMTGSFGDISCFSFYPTKGCGGFGDGGAITTNDNNIAEYIKMMRNYGSKKKYVFDKVGYNSRLDELQASLLRIKLRKLETLNIERLEIVDKYYKCIENEYISLPKVDRKANSVWHLFVIMCHQRDRLIEYLNNHNISTEIHYPIPPISNKAYNYLNISINSFPKAMEYSNNVLSIPLFNGMEEIEIQYLIEIINGFGG